MARRTTRDLTVGSMFALALVILALAIMAVGGESGLFLNRAHYSVAFQDATGLLVGAPVRMAGVEVGTVTGIQLPTDPRAESIPVQLGIDLAYAGRIREDSRATMRVLQLLTNEKFVEIIPGTPGSAPLDEGAEIPLLVKIDYLERGETIAEDLTEIMDSLKTILGSLEAGKGLLGQMLHDPEFGQQGLVALGSALENIDLLTAEVLEGRSLFGRLLTDESLGGKLDDLGMGIERFASVMDAIDRGQGAMGELLAEDGAGKQAIVDLQEAAATLNVVARRLEAGEGLLGRILNDGEYSEAVADDLAAMMHNLAEISRKINEGEGSLGALVNERVLYDGAEDVVAGVNDSKFARWLTRHYRKKGIEAEDRAGADDLPDDVPGESPQDGP